MSNVLSTSTTDFVVIPLCPVLIWIVLVGFFVSICFAVNDGIARLKRLHQVPCSRCAFFTGDYRLKCTVHPCKALSENAIGCLDYEPIPLPKLVRSPIKPAFNKRLNLHRQSDF